MTRRRKSEQAIPSRWDRKKQKLKPDLRSSQARLKVLRRIVLPFFLLASIVGLVVLARWGWLQLPHPLIPPIERKHEGFPKVVIEGLTAMPESTVIEAVQNHLRGELAFISLSAIKEQLESIGQVKEARVRKEFPDTLHITIVEYQPVLMLAAQLESGDLTFWAVREDGVLFKPHDAARMMTLGLPFLEGVKLTSIEDGVTRVEGMKQVQYLLQLLKRDLYPVYSDLRSVSLERYRGGVADLGSVIILRGRQLREVHFGIDNLDFQMIKLMGVISVAGRIKLDQKKVIDLSLPGDAMIR
jgi:hypothetical protein